MLSGALLLLRFYPRAMVAYEVESKMQAPRRWVPFSRLRLLSGFRAISLFGSFTSGDRFNASHQSKEQLWIWGNPVTPVRGLVLFGEDHLLLNKQSFVWPIHLGSELQYLQACMEPILPVLTSAWREPASSSLGSSPFFFSR